MTPSVEVYYYNSLEDRKRRTKEGGISIRGKAHTPLELVALIGKVPYGCSVNYFQDNKCLGDFGKAAELLGATYDPHSEEWLYKGSPIWA